MWVKGLSPTELFKVDAATAEVYRKIIDSYYAIIKEYYLSTESEPVPPIRPLDLLSIIVSASVMDDVLERYLERHKSFDVGDALLYSFVTALLAMKLRDRHEVFCADTTKFIGLLDKIVCTHRFNKKETIAHLTQLKAEVTRRIVKVRKSRRKQFIFPSTHQTYAERKDAIKNPSEFFDQVYAKYVTYGLEPADIRTVDPPYYNAFHVWCSRNGRKISEFFDQSPRKSTNVSGSPLRTKNRRTKGKAR
jgi:hypothetical protein